MRIAAQTLLFVFAAAAACTADRPVEPRSAVPVPTASAALNLATTGGNDLFQSVAVAINDSGVVAGTATLVPGGPLRVVEWRPPDYRVTVLPDAGAGFPLVNAISRDGTIGGSVCDSVYRNCRPAYWRNGAYHQLPGLGAVKDVCSCDGRTLVGRVTIDGHDHAAIWEDDLLIDLGVPDDRASAELVGIAHGFVIGSSYQNTEETGATQRRDYRWSPSSGWVPLASEVSVNDVNARGSVIGGFGIIWPDGSNTPEALGGEGLPVAINDSNVVAGVCVPNPKTPTSGELPCEWTAELGWFAIGPELTADVRGINNANLAVGDIYDFEQHRSFAALWRP